MHCTKHVPVYGYWFKIRNDCFRCHFIHAVNVQAKNRILFDRLVVSKAGNEMGQVNELQLENLKNVSDFAVSYRVDSERILLVNLIRFFRVKRFCVQNPSLPDQVRKILGYFQLQCNRIWSWLVECGYCYHWVIRNCNWNRPS